VKITILRSPPSARQERLEPGPLPTSALSKPCASSWGPLLGALRSPTTVKQPSVPYSRQVSWRAPQHSAPGTAPAQSEDLAMKSSRSDRSPRRPAQPRRRSTARSSPTFSKLPLSEHCPLRKGSPGCLLSQDRRLGWTSSRPVTATGPGPEGRPSDSATTLPRASSRRRSSFESATSASASLAQLGEPSSSGRERSDGSSGRRSRRPSLEINKATTEYSPGRHHQRGAQEASPRPTERKSADPIHRWGMDRLTPTASRPRKHPMLQRFLGGPRGLPHTQAPAQSTRENKGPRTRGLRSIFKVKTTTPS